MPIFCLPSQVPVTQGRYKLSSDANTLHEFVTRVGHQKHPRMRKLYKISKHTDKNAQTGCWVLAKGRQNTNQIRGERDMWGNLFGWDKLEARVSRKDQRWPVLGSVLSPYAHSGGAGRVPVNLIWHQIFMWIKWLLGEWGVSVSWWVSVGNKGTWKRG